MKQVVLIFVFLISLLTPSNVFSQEVVEKDTIDKPVPNSIYSFQSTTLSFNNRISLNNSLNLKQYHFLYLNKHHIEDGYFTLPLTFNGGKPSNLIYDSYKDIYHSMHLKSSFYKISKLYNAASRIEK